VFSHFALRQPANDVAQRQNIFQHVVSDPDTFLFADAVANILRSSGGLELWQRASTLGCNIKCPTPNLFVTKSAAHTPHVNVS
jgi:hypothetical protein